MFAQHFSAKAGKARTTFRDRTTFAQPRSPAQTLGAFKFKRFAVPDGLWNCTAYFGSQ